MTTRSTTHAGNGPGFDIEVRQEAAERELQVAGVVPWSLQGAYMSVSALAPTARGADLVVRAIDVSKQRRVGYHASRITIASDILRERLVAERSAAHEPVRAVRWEGQLLLNVPLYGVLAMDPDVSHVAARQCVAATERSLLAASGPTAHLRAIAAPSELTCWLASQEDPLRFALDERTACIRELGIEGSYLVATRARGDEPGQLGIASVDSSDFTWHAIALWREHRLLAVRAGNARVVVWIAEVRDSPPSTRIRGFSIDVRDGTLGALACHELGATGPFGVAPPAADPHYVYARRLGHADDVPALLRLNLQTGVTAVADCAFGSELGAPVVAAELDGQRSWLLVTAHDSMRDRTELAFREIRDFARAPIAIAQLPPGFEVGAESVWI